MSKDQGSIEAEDIDDIGEAELIEMSNIDTRIAIVTLVGTAPLLTHGMSAEQVFNTLHRGDRPQPDKTASARKVASAGLILAPKGHLHEGKPCVHAEMMFGMMKTAGRGMKIGKNSISTAKSTKLPFLMQVLDDFILIESEEDWEPDVMRGTGQTGGAVPAIRPRWDEWSITFSLRIVLAYGFTVKTAFDILDNAGAFVGLGGYRPSRNGRYGMFGVSQMHHWNGGKLPRPTFDSAVEELDGPPSGWIDPTGRQPVQIEASAK